MKPAILVPVDNTPVSKEVLRFADDWAARVSARLVVLHCRSAAIQDLIERGELQNPEPSFEAHLQALQLRSEVEIVHLFADPADGILKLQDELEPELTIMAAHSHTLAGRLFLGSNTDMVLHQGSTPIFVYKQTQRDPQQVVVPLDLSSISESLLRKADELALARQGKLHLLHVLDYPEIHVVGGGAFYGVAIDGGFLQERREQLLEHGRKSLEELVAQVELKSPYQLHLEFGTPYLQALQLAERVNAGLMVIGAHDHTALGRLLMGSNTDYLVHNYEGSLYVHKELQS